ncbi:hypothetical protein D3C86_1663800 [compost metagenome]
MLLCAFLLLFPKGPAPLADVPMTDHHGKPVSWSSYRGKWLVVYFGYTGCPDACPTGLTEIAKEMKALGKDAERVQVALVTLDPERDTPQVLAGYVPYFAPSFVGLRPARAEMEAVIRPFGVQVEKAPAKSGQGYELNHSLDFFVIDPEGRLQSRFLTPLPPGAFRKALHRAS